MQRFLETNTYKHSLRNYQICIFRILLKTLSCIFSHQTVLLSMVREPAYWLPLWHLMNQHTAQIEVNTNRMAVRGLFIIRKVYGGSGVRILIRLCIHEYYVDRDNVVSFH